jgi:molecular chaperone IbpA
MRTFDPTLLWRSTVGFDRLFDLIASSPSPTGDDHYPPYNIEWTGEDIDRISLRLPDTRPERSP